MVFHLTEKFTGIPSIGVFDYMIWINANELLPVKGYLKVRRYSSIFYKNGYYISDLRHSYNTIKHINIVSDDDSILWTLWEY